MSNDDLNPIERTILRREAMKQFAKYLPSLGVAGLAALHFLLPSLQAFAAANPKSVVGVLLAAVIAAYHAPSPNQQ